MKRANYYPRLQKAMTAALAETLDSLPASERRLIRGRWRWRMAPILDLDSDGYDHTAACTDGNGVITFDLPFIERLVNAGEARALIGLCAHELGHRVRQLRGEAATDEAAEERAVNQLVRDMGFGRDLQRLRTASGYSDRGSDGESFVDALGPPPADRGRAPA